MGHLSSGGAPCLECLTSPLPMPMRPTVLIVEDEPAIAANIAYALRTDGFEVVHVTLGGDAIPVLTAQSINAVVLDVGLPDINGFELCKQIRLISQVPVLFVTARSDEIDRIVGLEIGADDYIVKPFSPRELVARIKTILRRSEPAISSSITWRCICCCARRTTRCCSARCWYSPYWQ